VIYINSAVSVIPHIHHKIQYSILDKEKMAAELQKKRRRWVVVLVGHKTNKTSATRLTRSWDAFGGLEIHQNVTVAGSVARVMTESSIVSHDHP